MTTTDEIRIRLTKRYPGHFAVVRVEQRNDERESWVASSSVAPDVDRCAITNTVVFVDRPTRCADNWDGKGMALAALSKALGFELPVNEEAVAAGERAFLAGDGYDAAKGEAWCYGWAVAQKYHDAAVARESDCGVEDCPHCQ